MTIFKLVTKSRLSSLFLTVALGLAACAQNPGENPGEPPLLECGNGALEDGESCDDGNNASGDGCSSACEEEEPSEAEQIDAYIEGLGTLNNPAPLAETPEGTPTDTSYGPYECATQNFRQVSVIDSFKLQGGALQERIFPGMLLSGNSLAVGKFDEVIVNKKPLILSHDVGQLPISTIQMAEPSPGSFAQARTDLLVAQLGDQTFTAQSVDVLDVTTINEDELSLSLGFDVSAGIATEVDVKGGFDFSSETTQSRFLVRIINELYTMKIDPVTFASDFFAEDVSLQTVQSLFQEGSPPVYVDTVTYGRELYVMVESNSSERELKLALEAAVSNDAAQFDAALDFGLTSRQVLDETTIKGIVVGPIDSDASDIGRLSGSERIEALSELRKREAILSKNSLGQPISFTVRYLPSVFGNAQSVVDASYPREDCVRVRQNIQVQLDSITVTGIDDDGTGEGSGALELFGTINVSSLDSLGNAGNIFDLGTANARSVGSTAVLFGQAQNRTIIEIKPEEQKDIRIIVNLGDEDDIGSAENIISLSPTLYPFGSGFSLEDTLTFGTNQGQVEIKLSMKPVF